jgi:hypothetical protein
MLLGVSLFDIKVVATYYSGATLPRSAYYFKQWSQSTALSNVNNFGEIGGVTINSGLLYSCFNSDSTNFAAGTMGVCATLTGSGLVPYFLGGFVLNTGVFLYLKNRNNAAGTGYCTVFTVNVSRINS